MTDDYIRHLEDEHDDDAYDLQAELGEVPAGVGLLHLAADSLFRARAYRLMSDVCLSALDHLGDSRGSAGERVTVSSGPSSRPKPVICLGCGRQIKTVGEPLFCSLCSSEMERP